MEYPATLNAFCNYMSHLNRSKLTIENYRGDLCMFFQYLRASEKHAVPTEEELFGEAIADFSLSELEKIKNEDIFRFLRYVSEERGNKPAARARKLSAIKSFFNYLVNVRGDFAVNPAAAISSPKIDKRLPKHLSLEESVELLEAVDEDEESAYKERDYCMVTFFLNCGMRLSELVGINLADIDRDHTRLRVIGKGSKERVVYLNDACKRALEDYLKVRGWGREIKEKNALFISRLGKRVSRRTVQHVVYKYLDRAGLGYKHLSTHKLRHTAATLMYQEGGVDVRVLKEILGHEQLNTTQIYTHVNNDQVRDAMDQNPLAELKKKKK